LIALFIVSVLILGFSVGRFTSVLHTGKMASAAKENAEFKKLDDAEKAIALAIAAASPQISKEIITNLEKKGNLPREAFAKVMDLAKGVGSMAPGQKPTAQQAPTTIEDILKEKVDVSYTETAYKKGSDKAPIKVVTFTEFLCPFCGKVDPTLNELQKTYGPDKVQIIFQSRLIHGERAAFYHRAAYAAGKQGKFWEFAEALFSTQTEWVRTPAEEAWDKVVAPKAKALGLNVNKLKKDMESDAAKKWVEDEDAMGNKMGVRGTPTVFVNGHMVRGARDLDFFKQIVDKLLGS
jgi:protein-disulfide isomerase